MDVNDGVTAYELPTRNFVSVLDLHAPDASECQKSLSEK